MRKKQLIRRKGIPGVLAGMLVMTSLLSACRSEETSAVQEISAVQETQEESSAAETIQSTEGETDRKDKEETVYVKAAATGQATEITVETKLKNPGNTETIEDFTKLTDIRNKEGDEEFTLSEDGNLVWENHGEDIFYEGKSTSELPVTLKVTYTLDGTEIAPDDLMGKSGHVTIRFDYENHTFEDVEENGEKTGVRVPFTVISAMFLSEETASNIEVTNGKVMDMDDVQVVVGIAFPGLMDSLKLEDYEATEEMEIPEYVEVSFDAVDFELDFTASIVSSGLMEDMDLDGLDDVDDLIDSMDELLDASKELVDGAEALSDGTDTFREYFSEYTSGIDAISTGSSQLTKGLKTMKDQKDSLVSGAKQLQSSLEEIEKELTAAGLPSQEEFENNEVYMAAEALAKDAIALAENLELLQTALDALQSYAEQAAKINEKAAAAVEELKKADVSAAEAAATAKAREQAKNALAETELTDEEKQAVVDSIDVSGTMSDVETHIKNALAVLDEIPPLNIPENTVDAAALQALLADMSKQMAVLKAYADQLGGLDETIADFSAVMEELQSAASQLSKGSSQLTEGIKAFSEGIDQLYTGSAALSSGAAQLASAGGELADGLDTLADGMKAMAEGVNTFDEEGIQELGRLAGDDLEKVLNHIRALKTADASYINFGGIREGQTGSVRFIIETEEIKSEE